MVKQMKKIAGLFMMILMLVPATVFADYRIIDSAGLFYTDEVKQIQELAQQIEKEYHMNVLVMTDMDHNGKSSTQKAEDCYEELGYCENEQHGGISLIIDMANREINLVTDRDMIYYITDAREEEIYDAGYGYVSNGEYGDSCIAMLEKVQRELRAGIPNHQYIYDQETGKVIRYRKLTATDMVIALITGIITSMIICLLIRNSYGHIKKYKYRVNENASMRITSENERLVRKSVTKHRIHIDKPSSGGGRSSGGRSTVHHSSSGRSFGGGHGRKF